jgi:WD40 repeat protein
VALVAAAVPVVLGEGRAAAGVSEELVAKTCGLVADWSAGVVVPGAVAKLAEGGLPVRTILLVGVVTVALTAAGVVLATGPTNPPQPNEPPRLPDAPLAKADPQPQPRPAPAADAKPDDKPVPLGAPRVRKAIDLPMHRVNEIAWAPDGKGLAIRNYSVPDGKGPNEGTNRVLHVPDVTADHIGHRWMVLPRAGNLVGFTPDGKSLLTAVREYNLVSGFHRLEVWSTASAKPGSPAATPMGGAGDGALGGETTFFRPARAIDLDPDRTFGYAIAPDSKTFRTVYVEFKEPGVIGVLEVREVSMETGKTTKAFPRVEGEFVNYAFSPDGKQLVTFDKQEVISAHDAQTGKQLWHQAPKFDRLEGSSGIGGSRDQRATFQYSPDGKRLVYTADFIRPIVFDARTGELRSSLENTSLLRTLAAPGCFSQDGRLLALSGDRYVARESKKDFGGGRGPVSYTAEGRFLTVWNTETGKVVKSWDQKATVMFLPSRPVLAVFEENGSGGTRLGLWDFATEATEKK